MESPLEGSQHREQIQSRQQRERAAGRYRARPAAARGSAATCGISPADCRARYAASNDVGRGPALKVGAPAGHAEALWLPRRPARIGGVA